MGIKDFSKIFTYTREVKFADLKNKKIAIDAMTEIWRASLGAMNKLTDANGNPTIHINVILAIILDLQKNNIKQIWVLKHALARAPFVDQTQSMNIFMAVPDYNKLLNCHMWAWKNGLKTGMYYLRTKPAESAVKVTVDPNIIKKIDNNNDICDTCSA